MMLIANPSRRLALLLTVALSCSLTARADETSHRAKANEVMVILNTQRMVQNISENLKKQIADAARPNLPAPHRPKAEKQRLRTSRKKRIQVVDAQLGWRYHASQLHRHLRKELHRGAVGQHYCVLYKSPAGLAMLQTMPTVNDQLTQVGNSHMTALQPQLKQLFEDFQKSVAAASAPPAGAPAQTPALAPSPAPAAPGKGK